MDKQELMYEMMEVFGDLDILYEKIRIRMLDFFDKLPVGTIIRDKETEVKLFEKVTTDTWFAEKSEEQGDFLSLIGSYIDFYEFEEKYIIILPEE